jgi:Flp pilus assembly protein CpaB
MLRTVYLTAFVILSAVAGLFYYSQTRLVPAVVATTDLRVGTQIQDSDVAIRRVSPGSIPAGTYADLALAIGRFVSFPILRDQYIGARAVAVSRNADLLAGGLDIPKGYRIISLPIVPSSAVGGSLKPGDLVDVIAIPGSNKASGLLEQSPAAPIIIGTRVMVLGLRTDQGTTLDPSTGSHGIGSVGNKPASILLAIPEPDETRYSAALANSTFFIALTTD